MIAFILIGVVVILGLAFALVAYSANNRKRAAQKDTAVLRTESPSQGRAPGNN